MNGRPGPGPAIWGRSQGGKEDSPSVFACLFLPLPPLPTRALIICTHIHSTFFRFTAGTKKATQNEVVLLSFLNGASLLENCLSFSTVSPSGMMNVIHAVCVCGGGGCGRGSGIRVCGRLPAGIYLCSPAPPPLPPHACSEPEGKLPLYLFFSFVTN